MENDMHGVREQMIGRNRSRKDRKWSNHGGVNEKNGKTVNRKWCGEKREPGKERTMSGGRQGRKDCIQAWRKG